MNAATPLGEIQVYSDKFDFIEAKKFLALKGPLAIEVIQDSMYPLWRYGEKLILKTIEDGPKVGMAVCFWHEGVIHHCIIKELSGSGFKVYFLNRDQNDFGEVEQKLLLGQIVGPKLSPLWRLRLWWRLRA